MVKKGVLCVSKNLEGGRRQLQPSQDTQCLKNMKKEQFGDVSVISSVTYSHSILDNVTKGALSKRDWCPELHYFPHFFRAL